MFNLTRDSVDGSQSVMKGDNCKSQTHSHLVSLFEGSKPTGQEQSASWIARCRMESVELPHGPSAKRLIVSELCGENKLNVRLVQILSTL